MTKTIVASTNPLADLDKITYKGQDPKRRMYRPGYEDYFNRMPQLYDSDPCLMKNLHDSKALMEELAAKLRYETWVSAEDIPNPGEFNRTILALETPKVVEGMFNEDSPMYKEGKEFIVAKWGDGFTSITHGHTFGYLHEQLLFGKIVVRTYRMTEPDSILVRPVEMITIDKPGEIAFLYTKQKKDAFFQRQTLIHDFTSVGFSASLHYISEHTRDGRDNAFKVEHFGVGIQDVTRITHEEALHSKTGDVILAKSKDFPEYGSHYLLMTGKTVVKQHGLRPEEYAIPANTDLIDDFYPDQDLVLLKLNSKAAHQFYEFHGITFSAEGKPILPTA